MMPIQIEIEYCVPCGYQNLASWTLSEMFSAVGTNASVSVTPGDSGVYKISVNGDVWYDKAQQGRTPDINDMKDLKARLSNLG